MSPLDPHRELAVARYAKEVKMPDAGTLSPATLDPILKRTATRVGRIQVLVGAIVVLIGGIIAGTVYVDHLASQDDVRAEVAAHAAIPGHAGMVQEMRGVSERLIRVETQLGQMLTTQERMDNKLDRLLSAGAAWRQPLPDPKPEP